MKLRYNFYRGFVYSTFLRRQESENPYYEVIILLDAECENQIKFKIKNNDFEMSQVLVKSYIDKNIYKE